jgi:hypothetical protein
MQAILKDIESMGLEQLRLVKNKVDSESQLLLHQVELNQDRVCRGCGAHGFWKGHEDQHAAQYIMVCECGHEEVIE